MADGWEYFDQRTEPSCLKLGKEYISLRTCTEISRLRTLADSLDNGTCVILPWISPPYGIVKGYGIYNPDEAQRIIQQSKDEGWGFPKPGHIYDANWVQRRIAQIESSR